MKTAANSAGVAPITGQAKAVQPAPTPAPALRMALLGWDGWNWQVLDTDGDENQARLKATEWLDGRQHGACYVMIPNGDKARARRVTRVEWGK